MATDFSLSMKPVNRIQVLILKQLTMETGKYTDRIILNTWKYTDRS